MIRTQIALGILLMIASIAAVTYLGVNEFGEQGRLAQTTDAQLAKRIEKGAELYHTACASCHGEQAEGTPGLCPPLNNVALLKQRVIETGWTGSLHSYIVNTIRGGRLTSTRPDQYVGTSSEGMAMPFWSQDFGGPLRNDQIEDIALFIQNFPDDPEALAEQPQAEATPIPEGQEMEAAFAIYQENGCASCHALDAVGAAGAVGPTHNGMGTIAEERVNDPNYTGSAQTAEEYIRESILDPKAYIVEGFPDAMPAFPNLSEEQLDVLVQMLLQQ